MTLRVLENKPGVVYDAGNANVIFAEDWNGIQDEIDAVAGSIPSVPTKATGAEINTGTDDTKFATPKAIADSNVAFLSDIPSVPVKASGSEINTGTDDTKFATPKAIADSNVAFLSDIPATPTFLAPRVSSTTSSSTPTPNADTDDVYILTALSAGATFGAPTGSPVQGQKLIIRVKDNGTARSLAWNGAYRASSDLALPTTTVISKTLYLGFMYNSTDSKWDLLALLNNF